MGPLVNTLTNQPAGNSQSWTTSKYLTDFTFSRNPISEQCPHELWRPPAKIVPSRGKNDPWSLQMGPRSGNPPQITLLCFIKSRGFYSKTEKDKSEPLNFDEYLPNAFQIKTGETDEWKSDVRFHFYVAIFCVMTFMKHESEICCILWRIIARLVCQYWNFAKLLLS